jgi:chromosome segregation ATPase
MAARKEPAMAEEKKNMSVVRNQPYKKASLHIRERHNERLNDSYLNPDIVKERSSLNVRFKSPAEGYAKDFDKMQEAGVISLKGLSKDPAKPPNVVDEMVFDVNTAYFEENGGYEFAREFYAKAYEFACKIAGGERYVLSAAMHADERNKAESERLGHDVFHYHLHVMYVPVVVKEERYSMRNKNKELAGTLKGTFAQVSHSKKWPMRDENGENAYSTLQDGFHDFMKEAGFRDFERGERKSTAKHMQMMDYKLSQDRKRADALEAEISGMDTSLAGKLADIADAEARLRGASSKLAKKEEESQALDEGIERKREASQALDEGIERKREASQALDREIERKREASQGLDRDIERKREASQGLDRDIERKAQAASALDAKVADAESRVEAIKSNAIAIMRGQQEEFAKGQIELDGVTREIGSKKIELAGAAREIGSKKIELAGTAREIGSRKVELDGVTREIGARKVELAGVTREIGARRIELGDVTREISARKIELAGVKREIGAKRSELDFLGASVAELERERARKASELEGLILDIGTSVARAKSMKQEVTERVEELKGLDGKISWRLKEMEKLGAAWADVDAIESRSTVTLLTNKIALSQEDWQGILGMAKRASMLNTSLSSFSIPDASAGDRKAKRRQTRKQREGQIKTMGLEAACSSQARAAITR